MGFNVACDVSNCCVGRSALACPDVSGEVVQLTHERAKAEEVRPYLQDLAHPVPVLSVYGRSAALPPECHPRQAVLYGWLDGVFTLAQNACFPEDTLTLLFEEDWRLHPSHEAAEKAQDERATELQSSAPYRATGSGGSASSAEPSAGAARQRGLAYTAPRRHTEPHETPQWLQDVVGFCNQAHHANVGDVVWLGWGRGTSPQKLCPTHGSHALAFAKRAAACMQATLHAGDVWHADVMLRRTLAQDAATGGPLQRNSWVFPSVGSFAEHTSGCEVDLGVRTHTWGQLHVAGGTRPEQDPKGRVRQLLTWTQRGARRQDHHKLVAVLQGPQQNYSRVWRTLHPAALGDNQEPGGAADTSDWHPVYGQSYLAQDHRRAACDPWGQAFDDQDVEKPTSARALRNRRKTSGAWWQYRVFTNAEALQPLAPPTSAIPPGETRAASSGPDAAPPSNPAAQTRTRPRVASLPAPPRPGKCRRRGP